MKMVTDDRQRVAIYARVSSEQQAKEGTIHSQLEALRAQVQADGLVVDEELCFIDDGVSGATLVRPALERLRDLAYAGGIDRLYVHAPDRLARKFAHQAVLLEELQRDGVKVVFLNQPASSGPEGELLVQIQGVIAEYERAKILERSRRGRRSAARRGLVQVLAAAPYGYRYVPKHLGGGQAAYEVVPEQARVVQQIFTWLACEELSLEAIARRLQTEGILSPTGRPRWQRSTLWKLLTNPAYQGTARYGKTRVGVRREQLRPIRGYREVRQAYSVYRTAETEQETIAVPALVDVELFAAAQERWAIHKRRLRAPRGQRYLLQGLLVCRRCNYSYCGMRAGTRRYYRCTGADASRFGGERLCTNGGLAADLLEEAVWHDACALLRDPKRIRAEYERRLDRSAPQNVATASRQIADMIHNVQRSLARLIDAYQEGLLDKRDFEARLRAAKQRLARLQTEQETLRQQQVQEEELRLVYGHWQEFAARVEQGLQNPDRATRREIIRALVKRVEIDEQQVRIIYRVSPPTPYGEREANVLDCPRLRAT